MIPLRMKSEEAEGAEAGRGHWAMKGEGGEEGSLYHEKDSSLQLVVGDCTEVLHNAFVAPVRLVFVGICVVLPAETVLSAFEMDGMATVFALQRRLANIDRETDCLVQRGAVPVRRMIHQTRHLRTRTSSSGKYPHVDSPP